MLEGDGEAVALVGLMAAASYPPWSDRIFSECQEWTHTLTGRSSDQPPRHTDVDGPGAIPHQALCILLWPVEGYTPTVCSRYFFSQSASYSDCP
jgi:hypothetical protein